MHHFDSAKPLVRRVGSTKPTAGRPFTKVDGGRECSQAIIGKEARPEGQGLSTIAQVESFVNQDPVPTSHFPPSERGEGRE